MARQSQDVVVRFIGDTGNLSRGADQVSGRLQTVATSMQGIATAGGVLGAISFFGKAISEARDAERVTRQTEQVIRSTGGAANVTAKQIGELAEALSEKAAVDDEVVQHGANVLATFTKVRNETGKGNDIFNQATEAALDMSAALSESGDTGAGLQDNVTKLGKALNDPIKGISALSRVGVTFTEQQKAQIKTLVESGDVMGAQKIILAELKTEFGGMAEASADSAGKAQVSWGNFAEDVGTKVMPAVHAVSNWALHTGLPTLGRVADTVGNVVEPAFEELVETGGDVVGMWQSMPSPIQNSAIALGAWALVGSRVEGFFTRSAGPLKTFGQDVQTVMTASQGSVGRFGASMQVIQDRVPTVGAMGAAFRRAKGDTDGFGGSLRGVASAGFSGLRTAAGGLIGVLGGPWGLAIAGAVAGLTWLASRSAEARQRQEEVAEAGRSVARALAETDGAFTKSTRAAAAKAAEDAGLLKIAEDLKLSMPLVTDAVEGQAGAYEKLVDPIQAVVDAKTAEIEDLKDVRGSTARIEQLTAERDSYEGYLNTLNDAVNGRDSEAAAIQRQTAAEQKSAVATAASTAQKQAAVPASEQFRAVIESTGVEFDEAADFGTQLADAIRAITGEQMTAVEAEEAYHASLDALSESIRQNGATLDVRTEKGRANRDAVEAAALAIRDQTLADIESGVPMDQALKRHNDRIGALRNETTKTFGANSAANTLITTYGEVPKEVVTAIKQKGYEDVMAKLKSLSAGQFMLEEGIPITPANTRAVLNEKRYRAAHGGFVSGPGTPLSDSIPALLSHKEFVNQASSVDYYGVPFFTALNQKQIPKEMLPGFAKGGPVWPMTVDVSDTKIPNPAIYPGGASIPALQAFARAQAGKRYLWGGTGPNAWDCSGLVGAIWALAHGMNPYQRHMTTAGMGPGRHGMKPGAGKVTVYLGPGHTAANIAGLHAEAYGGNGTPLAIGRVGTPLSFYDTIMHMRRGGWARLKNSADARRESFMESGWPEPGKVGQFRNGGWLEPGQFAYNETSKPEAVLNQDQLKALDRPNVTKILNVGGIHVTNRPADIMMEIRRLELRAGMV